MTDDEILRASCQHADDAVAGSLQSLDDGEHRSHADTTAGTHHGAEVLDMCSLAERTYHVGNLVAHVEVAELRGAHAHLLHHEGDGSGLNVGIGDGQRHTLTFLAHANDDEVSGTTSLGNQGSLDHQLEYFL